jgi:hypothetical protein
MGFTSHQQMHGEPPGRIVGCSQPLLSPALWWSVRTTPPSHTSEVAPKWTSGSTWFGKGSQGSAGLSFCVLVAISPRRAKWGGLPRGMSSADTSPPTTPAAGAPPAGPWQEPNWVYYAATCVECNIPLSHAFISRSALYIGLDNVG